MENVTDSLNSPFLQKQRFMVKGKSSQQYNEEEYFFIYLSSESSKIVILLKKEVLILFSPNLLFSMV